MRLEPIERFARLCKKNETTGCIEWTGCLISTGYGCFGFGGKGKTVLAHRWAAEYIGGLAVSPGTHVHHACENKRCVNPEHLSIVSPLQHAAEHASEFCKYGHLLQGEHLFVRKDGKRRCRTCNRNAARAFREQQKGAPLRSWSRRAA